MEEALSPPPDLGSRPSFSTFWKRTKDASTSGTRQVTFVPTDIPRIAKGCSSKKQSNSSSPADAHDVSRSSDSTHLGGRGSDQGEEGGMEGQEGGEAAHSSEESGESAGGAGASNGTAKEKAKIRRTQVRRAQIQHRKRKADYMRQLELDIDMLRDLISTTEQDMKSMKKDNEAIRAQLGVAAVARDDRSSASRGAGAVDFSGRAGGVSKTDTAMADMSVVAVKRGTSPSGTAPSSSHDSSIYSPSSIFAGIDLDFNLDDINVSIVMDKAIGNPAYQISSNASDTSLATFPDDLNAALTQGLPVSPFEAGFVPTLETGLANSIQPPAGRQVARPATTYYLPDLTVAETHSIVNLILALEHVCWGHACQPVKAPDTAMRAEEGHTMLATSLFLRDARGGVFSKIETSTKGVSGFLTNNPPEDAVATEKHVSEQQELDGIQWQASDVTLQTLYGLAVSLNPSSDKELAPVQAWFELASRYPLFLLLRTDVAEALKRELVSVVRCLYFGAVMEREAFERVVQRVVEPAMQAIDVAQVVPRSCGLASATAVAGFGSMY